MNSKVETVEELKGRRKTLHLGMLKLLREDLALQTEETLVGCLAMPRDEEKRAIKQRIIMDFDALIVEHDKVKPGEFNDDAKYQGMMNEAMNGKAYALKKMSIYMESVVAKMGQPALQAIFNAPFAEFGNRAAVLRLQTGITDFPWEAVVLELRADIDLGEWDAASVPAQALERVSAALGQDANVRSVLVKGVKLELNDGWLTKELQWSGKAAVKGAPATVGLLLRNCCRLLGLDIRWLLQWRLLVSFVLITYLPTYLPPAACLPTCLPTCLPYYIHPYSRLHVIVNRASVNLRSIVN